jgi:glycosyltransferase involved in cell wall biosynthesis
VKVLVTQPYVPAYRVPLFSALAEQLIEDGHELVLVAGSAGPKQRERGDSAHASVAHVMRELLLKLPGGREIRFRLLPRSFRRTSFGVVISELDPTNVFIWGYHLRHPRTPVVLWGHGASFVSKGSRASATARALLVRLTASAVLTYSEQGRASLRATLKRSQPPIYVVGNSTDTASLRDARASLTPDEEAKARQLVGSGDRALFVGGLDESKNITELLAAARHATALDPSFKLVIVGQGVLSELVAAAVVDGTAVWVPAARGRELAAIAQNCESLWMPGRVGLVAVDALALGLPLITVNHDSHAPELEFLKHGEVHFVDSDPKAFAVEARDAARAPHRERASEDLPSVEQVAARIRQAILRFL